MTSGAERRIHERYPISFTVTVESDAGTAEARVHNISQGGMLLEVALPLHTATEIGVSILNLSRNQPVRLEACVVHSRQIDNSPVHQVGITFLDAEQSLLARMLGQVLLIEDYRQRKGMQDFGTAAVQWIERYSSDVGDMMSPQ